MRPYLATARLAAYIPAREISMLLAVSLLRLAVFAVLVAVWSSFDAATLEAAGVSLPYLITYTALAQALALLMNPHTSLNEYISGGWIGVRLTWPVGMARLFAAEWCGRIFWSTVVSSAAIAVVGIPLGLYYPSLAQLTLFIVSLTLGVLVGVAVDYAFALLTARLNNGIWFANSIRQAFTAIVAGTVVPLAIMPWSIGDALQYLPFASMASAPLQVYMGASNAWFLLLLQVGWVVVLWSGLRLWSTKLGNSLVAAGG